MLVPPPPRRALVRELSARSRPCFGRQDPAHSPASPLWHARASGPTSCQCFLSCHVYVVCTLVFFWFPVADRLRQDGQLGPASASRTDESAANSEQDEAPPVHYRCASARVFTRFDPTTGAARVRRTDGGLLGRCRQGTDRRADPPLHSNAAAPAQVAPTFGRRRPPRSAAGNMLERMSRAKGVHRRLEGSSNGQLPRREAREHQQRTAGAIAAYMGGSVVGMVRRVDRYRASSSGAHPRRGRMHESVKIPLLPELRLAGQGGARPQRPSGGRSTRWRHARALARSKESRAQSLLLDEVALHGDGDIGSTWRPTGQSTLGARSCSAAGSCFVKSSSRSPEEHLQLDMARGEVLLQLHVSKNRPQRN